MARTFKDTLESDLNNTFLNSNEFGVSFTYRPASGITRTVAGVIDNTASYPEQQTGLAHQEFLDVFVSRDATGIPEPKLGDAVILAGDPDSEAWAYVESTEGDEHAWTLRFTRMRMKHIGGHRQSR